MIKGTHIAQALVAPSERQIAVTPLGTALKVDIGNSAYAGSVIRVAARLYPGQTTTFRTPADRFAPVFAEKI